MVKILLFIFILLCTSLDYLQIFNVPLWAAFGSVCILVLFPTRVGQRKVITILRELGPRIVIPWLGLCLWMLLVDYSVSDVTASMEDLVPANLGALAILVLACFMSMSLSAEALLAIFLFVGLAESAVGIMQFFEFDWSWELPDRLLESNFGIAGYFSAEDASFNTGRVRGLSIFVHKFSVQIGILAAFSTVYLVLGGRAINKRLNTLLVVSVPLMVATMAFTLTRTVIYCFVANMTIFLPLMLATVKTTRSRLQKRWVKFIALCGAVFLVIQLPAIDISLDFADTPSQRLFELEDDARFNTIRWLAVSQAYNAFIKSPVIGVGLEEVNRVTAIALHNVPFKMLAAYGGVGFLCYAFIYCSVASRLIMALKVSSPSRMIFFLASISALIMGFVDSLAHTSGFLFKDFIQPCFLGCFLGQTLGRYDTKMK